MGDAGLVSFIAKQPFLCRMHYVVLGVLRMARHISHSTCRPDEES